MQICWKNSVLGIYTKESWNGLKLTIYKLLSSDKQKVSRFSKEAEGRKDLAHVHIDLVPLNPTGNIQTQRETENMTTLYGRMIKEHQNGWQEQVFLLFI